MDPTEIRARLMGKYRQVVDERIARLQELFGALVETPQDEAMAVDLSRELHTLRGESRLMGFVTVDDVLCEVEKAIKTHRDGGFVRLSAFGGLFEESLVAVAAIANQGAQPDVVALCSRISEHLATGPSA